MEEEIQLDTRCAYHLQNSVALDVYHLIRNLNISIIPLVKLSP